MHPHVHGEPVSGADDQPTYDGPWSARRSGGITLVGGLIWLATLVVALNGPIVHDQHGTYRDGSAAMPLFFFAILMLGIGMWAVAATLPSTVRAARTAGLICGFAGLFWAFAPWLVPAGVVLSGGIAILAVASSRTGRWRRSDALLLVGAVGAAWLWLYVVLPAAGQPIATNEAFALALALLTPMWFVIAHALLRPARPTANPVAGSLPG
jgi:hypothetical protein